MGILLSSTYWRDANSVPVTADGVYIKDTQTLTGNNASGVAVPIFGITGTVEVRALYGVVTTALGANVTAAYWRLNDGTTQSNITVNTGTTLSAAPVGSTIVKKDVASAALTLLSSTQERVSEPTTLETWYFSHFLAVKKSTAATNIEFVYSTTDTPTAGVIDFWCRWLPLSADANIVAL